MQGRIAFFSVILLLVGLAIDVCLLMKTSWDDIRKAYAQQNCATVQTFTGNGIKDTQPFTVYQRYMAIALRLRKHYRRSTVQFLRNDRLQTWQYHSRVDNHPGEAGERYVIRERRSRHLLPQHRVSERNLDC